MLIRGKRFEVPQGYPKGPEGWLVNDQKFIDELHDIRDACAQNTNPRAKPTSLGTKPDLIYKRVFADFFSRHHPLWSHGKNGLRSTNITDLRFAAGGTGSNRVI